MGRQDGLSHVDCDQTIREYLGDDHTFIIDYMMYIDDDVVIMIAKHQLVLTFILFIKV